jgi:hypothetical protein
MEYSIHSSRMTLFFTESQRQLSLNHSRVPVIRSSPPNILCPSGTKFGEACFAMEFGHLAVTSQRVKRAEGPAVNSPAREGGGLPDPESEVRRSGTFGVQDLRR